MKIHWLWFTTRWAASLILLSRMKYRQVGQTEGGILFFEKEIILVFPDQDNLVNKNVITITKTNSCIQLYTLKNINFSMHANPG